MSCADAVEIKTFSFETHQNCCNLFVVVVVDDVEAFGAQSLLLGALKGNTNWVESYQLGYRLGSLPRSPRDYSFVKKICKDKREKRIISLCRYVINTFRNNQLSNALKCVHRRHANE